MTCIWEPSNATIKKLTFHVQTSLLIQTTATDFFQSRTPQDTHESLELEVRLLNPEFPPAPLSFLMQHKHTSGGPLTYHRAQRKYTARRNCLAGKSSNCGGTTVTKKTRVINCMISHKHSYLKQKKPARHCLKCNS